MKLISCSLLIFFIEMHNAKRHSSSSKIIRIPLTTTRQTISANARSRIILDDTGDTLGKISIGTPKRDFMVWFDTGSDYQWVFSSKYDTCDPGSETVLKNHILYNHEASSSYQPVTTYRKNNKAHLIRYGIGWAFGFLGSDIISIEGRDIRNEFMEATVTSKSEAMSLHNGIVGLRYNLTAGGNIIWKFCDEMKAEQKFSYYLPRLDPRSSFTGELSLCAEDESKYVAGTMKYVDETDPGIWNIPLDSVWQEGNTGATKISSKTKAVLDTGANRIYGPEDKLKRFSDFLKPYLIPNSPYREIDCKHRHLLPTVTFTIGGTNFSFTGRDYTSERQQPYCLVLIAPYKKKTRTWVFGEPFIRKYYTVFDMKNHKIGLAQSKG